ncbi:Pumilio [Citrus sinensis]|nr:Pumilio [Citrus sinensis]
MEKSSTGSDFETECENLLRCFDILEAINDATGQTSIAADSSSSSSSSSASSSSSSVPVPVAIPLYSENLWAVRSLSGRGDFGTSDFRFPSALQTIAFEHCTNHDLFSLAQDQEGSQYLQENLSSGDSRILDKLFWVVSGFTFELMSGQYGRFVFGKFIESCNESQLALIILKITFQDQLFLLASVDKFGSSSVKKLIKVVAHLPPLLYHVMSALKRLFKFLMMTKPGSSVILQCLEPSYNHKNDFIYQAALEHCLYLACHEQGCINLNNFIDNMKGSRRKQILHLISVNAASLSRHRSGNYVVQHVLSLEDPFLIDAICFALRGHYVDLSLTKCGSFVVQKCLKYQNAVHYIIEELLNSDQILQVANDKYGNYVIQTALAETMRQDRLSVHQRLVTKLQQHLAALRVMKYGSNVYKWTTASHPCLA